jgi:ABC-type branched-subunit amino acid transport system ATPase component
MMTIPALQITGLSKNFGALRVAHNIHFRVDQGARHALIGPNGAGKTTLLNLISGVMPPTSGTIRLAGLDITRMSQAERSRLGLARTFQINQLFHGLTVLDNVCLPIAERTGVSGSLLRPAGWHAHVTDEAIQLLRDLRLLDIALTRIDELAYGQQRLVEIAIALGQRPKVLLLDEPTAGVPASESQLLLEVIEALSHDISIVIIEHDMDVVFRFAQRITVLVGGSILTEGTPHEIANDAQVKAVYLGETDG